ncbi:2Fe-2S iron-sulfur cluster-binding protein [Paenibacillus yanchengensis]|uniref:2Fe-2S iron-sulfur cluster-binding protein n=1 Tax=Paenibacillus yanchengensis TaxID=2035833 RepID=A0ABW4YJX6_9BACL
MDAEITFWPSGRKVKVKQGTSVLMAARQAGVLISTRCGGNAACFLCKVQLLPNNEVMPMNEVERRKLGNPETAKFRLACQVKVTGKVEVEVPPDPLKAAVARQLAKQQEEDLLW